MSNAAVMGSEFELLGLNIIFLNGVQVKFEIINSQINDIIHNASEIKDGKMATIVAMDFL